MGPDLQRGYAPLERELDMIAARLRRSTVQVQGRRPGGGSGVIWRLTGGQRIVCEVAVSAGRSGTEAA